MQSDEIRCTDIQKLSETFFRLLATNINNAWHLTGVECSNCSMCASECKKRKRAQRNCLTSWIVLPFAFHQYGVCVCLPMWNWFRCYKHINECTRTHMQWAEAESACVPSKVCLCATSFASSQKNTQNRPKHSINFEICTQHLIPIDCNQTLLKKSNARPCRVEHDMTVRGNMPCMRLRMQK